jgi:hypothetical protein
VAPRGLREPVELLRVAGPVCRSVAGAAWAGSQER